MGVMRGKRLVAVNWSDDELRLISTLGPLKDAPLDTTNAYGNRWDAARFGQRLFFETGFSPGEPMSCTTCHKPGMFFVDRIPLAEGRVIEDRNTPTILNAAHFDDFFWDGRTDSLWSQAIEPFEDPREFATTRVAAARHVLNSPLLRRSYENIFGALPDFNDLARFPAHARPVPGESDHPHNVAWQTMTPADQDAANRVMANIGKSIAAFERTMVQSDPAAWSPFDRFADDLVRGGDGGGHLSGPAQRGLQLFLGRGKCLDCHFGPGIGGIGFQINGTPPRGGGSPRHPSRYAAIDIVKSSVFNAAGPYSDDPDGGAATLMRGLTRTEDDWGTFRVPSLRNIAQTAPYMHAGQMATLADVVEHYSTLEDAVIAGHHGLAVIEPLNLSAQEAEDLVAFLTSLTGGPPMPPTRREQTSDGMVGGTITK